MKFFRQRLFARIALCLVLLQAALPGFAAQRSAGAGIDSLAVELCTSDGVRQLAPADGGAAGGSGGGGAHTPHCPLCATGGAPALLSPSPLFLAVLSPQGVPPLRVGAVFFQSYQAREHVASRAPPLHS